MSYDEEVTKIEEIVDSLLSEDRAEVDLAIALEVAERINQSKEESTQFILKFYYVFADRRKIAVELIRQGMLKSNSQIVLNSVLLLETLVKNCNEKFHYEIASKSFMDSLLKLLKRKRRKLGLFDKFFLDAKFLDIIEFKILYMIQLWADTFMMHEDEFPFIMSTYRQLRQEGIVFPPRDKNEKFMIQFKGKKSPIFDHLEEIYKKQTEDPGKNHQQLYKADLNEPKIPAFQHEEEKDSPASEGYKDLDKVNQRKKEKEMPSNFDYETYNNFRLDKQELEILQSSLHLLDDVIQNAVSPQDLLSEIALEIVDNLKQARERVKMVTNFGSFLRPQDKEICEELSKTIKHKFISYKEKHDYLKSLAFTTCPRNKKPEPAQSGSQKSIPIKESTTPPKENPPAPPVQNPVATAPIKKIEPPKLSARGEQPKPIASPGFVDLLDLEDPVQLKNPTPGPGQQQELGSNAHKQEEEVKSSNPFDFDFNFVSQKKDESKKAVDQIDILFG